MLLSVIIASYNMAHDLRRTLESCAIQELNRNEWEVIVVDGSSTDSTKSIIANFEDVVSTFVSEPDGGVYDAMNKGANLARGTYLQFLNCGDVLANPHTLTRLADATRDGSNPCWIVSVAKHLHGGEREPTYVAHFPHRWWKHLLGKQPHIHQALFFRRDTFLQIGGYNKQTRVVADYELIIKLGILESPLELRHVTVIYAGGGISQQRRSSIPLLLHEVRTRRLELPATPRLLSLLFAQQKSVRERLQLRRRVSAIHDGVSAITGRSS